MNLTHSFIWVKKNLLYMSNSLHFPISYEALIFIYVSMNINACAWTLFISYPTCLASHWQRVKNSTQPAQVSILGEKRLKTWQKFCRQDIFFFGFVLTDSPFLFSFKISVSMQRNWRTNEIFYLTLVYTHSYSQQMSTR